jgi:hypothetical protein
MWAEEKARTVCPRSVQLGRGRSAVMKHGDRDAGTVAPASCCRHAESYRNPFRGFFECSPCPSRSAPSTSPKVHFHAIVCERQHQSSMNLKMRQALQMGFNNPEMGEGRRGALVVRPRPVREYRRIRTRSYGQAGSEPAVERRGRRTTENVAERSRSTGASPSSCRVRNSRTDSSLPFVSTCRFSLFAFLL